jgi:hypothetical protein
MLMEFFMKPLLLQDVVQTQPALQPTKRSLNPSTLQNMSKYPNVDRLFGQW